MSISIDDKPGACHNICVYLRINHNAQGVAYLQIARSYREAGKVNREILFSLGRLDVLQATGQIDALVKSLSRFATRQQLIDLSKDISVSQRGPALLLAARKWVRRLPARGAPSVLLRR